MPAAFCTDDFAIFEIGEFRPQIDTMRAVVTPKLESWGEEMVPRLERLLGHPVFPHVARHLRRKTTPPPETWVAWAPARRSYKSDPVIGLIASRDGLQARLMLKHEAYDLRRRLPELLAGDPSDLAAGLGKTYTLRAFYDRDMTARLPAALDPTDPEVWAELAAQAAKKTRAFDVGHAFTPAQSAALTPGKLRNAFAALLPIYRRITAGLAVG